MGKWRLFSLTFGRVLRDVERDRRLRWSFAIPMAYVVTVPVSFFFQGPALRIVALVNAVWVVAVLAVAAAEYHRQWSEVDCPDPANPGERVFLSVAGWLAGLLPSLGGRHNPPRL